LLRRTSPCSARFLKRAAFAFGFRQGTVSTVPQHRSQKTVSSRAQPRDLLFAFFQWHRLQPVIRRAKIQQHKQIGAGPERTSRQGAMVAYHVTTRPAPSGEAEGPAFRFSL